MLLVINFVLRKFSILQVVILLKAGTNYAVLVRNFNLRGNKSSVVMISNILIPVVAITLMIRSINDPKESHSSTII